MQEEEFENKLQDTILGYKKEIEKLKFNHHNKIKQIEEKQKKYKKMKEEDIQLKLMSYIDKEEKAKEMFETKEREYQLKITYLENDLMAKQACVLVFLSGKFFNFLILQTLVDDLKARLLKATKHMVLSAWHMDEKTKRRIAESKLDADMTKLEQEKISLKLHLDELETKLKDMSIFMERNKMKYEDLLCQYAKLQESYRNLQSSYERLMREQPKELKHELEKKINLVQKSVKRKRRKESPSENADLLKQLKDTEKVCILSRLLRKHFSMIGIGSQD
jgi:hypothetical protein